MDLKSRARMFSLEHSQLLTEGKDLQAEVVTGTEESLDGSSAAKAGEDPSDADLNRCVYGDSRPAAAFVSLSTLERHRKLQFIPDFN